MRVVGIDVGGSKTHLAIADIADVPDIADISDEAPAPRTLSNGHGPIERIVATEVWRTGDFAADGRGLAQLLEQTWGVEALTHPIGVGAHGCDTTQQCRDLEHALGAVASGPVRVVNDAELMPWAMGAPGGIGVVAGTGSIAVARDAQGELITAGGWGWVLGDEGSAAGLWREATRATLAALEAGDLTDPLVRAQLAAYDVSAGAELAMAVTRGNTAAGWGAHAPDVFAAADAGSERAATVIADAGHALADLVRRLRLRGVQDRHVVAGGGVIVAQPRLREAFLAALADHSPDLEVQILDTAPVRGALALACSVAAPAVPAVPTTPPTHAVPSYLPEVTS